MVFVWLRRRRHKQGLVSAHFWGYSWGTGMSYHTSTIPGLLWMLFQLLASVPPVTPGCCEPNPLLSSALGAQWGEANPAQRNPAVRVRGQGSSSSPSQMMKHKQLSGRQEWPRGTYTTMKLLYCFLYQELIKWPQIKSQKRLGPHSVWRVWQSATKLLRFSKVLVNTIMLSVMSF